MRKRTSLVCVLAAIVVFSAACSDNAGKYLERGKTLAAGGHAEEAIINYRKAVQKDPNLGDAYYNLGVTEFSRGNIGEAYRALQRAVEVMPAHKAAKVRLGELALGLFMADPRHQRVFYDHAATIAGELLAADPKSYEAHYLNGYVLMADGRLPAAMESLQKANSLAPHTPKVIMTYAEALVRSGRAGEAEVLVRESLKSEPEHAAAYDFLYSYYVSTKRESDAESILHRKLERHRKQGNVHLQLAAHYQRLGNLAKRDEVIKTLVNSADVPGTRLVMAGDFYASVREWETATASYEQGLKSDAKNAGLYRLRLAGVSAARNDRDRAIALLQQNIAQRQMEPESKRLHARLLQAQGTPESMAAAIKEYGALIAAAPQDSTLRVDAGKSYLAANDVEAARKEFQEAVRLNDRGVEARLALAEIAQEQGAAADALRLANEVTARDATNVRARLLRARALHSTGNTLEARTELESLRKDQPAARDVLLELARVAVAQKKYGEAEDLLTKAEAMGGRDEQLLRVRTEAAIAQGQIERALDTLDKAIAKSSNADNLRMLLADVAMKSGKLEVAKGQLESIAANPLAKPSVFLRLGEVYERQGNSAAALAQFEKVVQLQPGDAFVLAKVASIKNSVGQTGDAAARYEQSLKIDPNNAIYQNNLAFLLAEQKRDLDKALQLAQAAVRSRPDNSSYLDTLGWVYTNKRMYREAHQVLTKALRLQPKDAAALHYHLGITLLELGDRKQAGAEFDAALSQRPHKDLELRIRQAMPKAL